MKNRILFQTLLIITFLAVSLAYSQTTIPTMMSDQTADCIGCHNTETVGIYQEWGTSKHFRANVGCFECHQADLKDVDAFEHNGFTIAIIVSPKDCSNCHEREVQEFDESHHSKAGTILGSLDNSFHSIGFQLDHYLS